MSLRIGPHWWLRGKKNLPANAGSPGDVDSIPGSRKSPGEGNSNPLQYSYLGNPMDRGAWKATVHGVAESNTTEHNLRADHSLPAPGHIP